MNFLHSDLLRCPLDHLALHREEQQLRCDNGHSFDLARQGYVNLLGAGDKRSRDPGDSKEMVAARRAFLDGGHYHPVATALADLVRPLLDTGSVVVDAGCGEGYYLAQLQSQLAAQSGTPLHTHLNANLRQPTMIGFDISKWAVQAATQRAVATWLVASNRQIPLDPGSADCVLSLFGFPMYEAFRAVLKEGGTLLLANAGPRHLIELREALYSEVRHTQSTVPQQASAAGLIVGASSTVHYQTAPLSQLAITQLLGMTPHLFRASYAGKQRTAQLDQFPVTVDVHFQLLHKRE